VTTSLVKKVAKCIPADRQDARHLHPPTLLALADEVIEKEFRKAKNLDR
jgi:hypothetical protein